MNVGVNAMIAITAPSSLDLSITPSATGATLSTASGNIVVSTNNPTGYKLTVGLVDTATSTALVNTYQPSTTTTYAIPTLTAFTTVADFPTNYWGYSTESSTAITTYNPIPAIGSTNTITTTAGPATTSTTPFNLGVKTDATMASGTYTNTVQFTAVTNYIPTVIYKVNYDANGGSGAPATQIYAPTSDTETSHEFTLTDLDNSSIPTRSGYTFGGWTTVATNTAAAYSPGSQLYLASDSPEVTLYAIWVPDSEMGFGSLTGANATMQNMTGDICSAVTTTGTTGRLQDTRDYKIYYVTKEADGNCWMTQNLALELSTNKTLTISDSDVSADLTPVRNTIAYNNLSSTTWPDGYTPYPYSYNPGDSYYTTSGSTSAETEATSGDAHYTAGNYYNWSASVASNDISSYSSDETAPDSICPKGWRLPATSSSPSEFGTLLYDAGIIASATASKNYQTNGFNNIRISPLWWVRAGNVKAGAFQNLGSTGYYWSNATTSAAPYRFVFSAGSADPRNNPAEWSRFGSGQSVRCIAK